MTIFRRFAIWIGLALALIVSIVPAAAVLRAEDSQRPLESHDFTDVPVANKAWMEEWIDAFYHQGVTTGCNQAPLEYCPEREVTRAEMAVFFGRALGYVDMGADGYTAEAYFDQTGTSAAANGVVGRSPNGVGVFGEATFGGVGVYGRGNSSYGVRGHSTSSYGVFASSTNSIGLGAQSGADLANENIFDLYLEGMFGEIGGNNLWLQAYDNVVVNIDHNGNSTSFFTVVNTAHTALLTVDEAGNVEVNGTLSADGLEISAGGTKNNIVDTVHYGTRKLYAVESTEVWFEDMGFGQLVNGVAVIEIDPMYAETVNLSEAYHVFAMPTGEWADLYISETTPTSFTVRAADRHSNIRFSYRIIAKRLGFEDERMEEVED